MRYPHDNFKSDWNVTAGYYFGDSTSYGFHDGIDVNDNNSGNSDLGKPIYAIADGICTSIHSHPTGFGYHLHYKIEGPWGVRWVHHAHCQEIYLTEGAPVTEGQIIARVGNSGTTYAHDHWALKREPVGIDAVATSKQALASWEDPLKFVEEWMGYNKPKETEMVTEQTKLPLFDNKEQQQVKAEYDAKDRKISDDKIIIDRLNGDLSKTVYAMQELQQAFADYKQIHPDIPAIPPTSEPPVTPPPAKVQVEFPELVNNFIRSLMKKLGL